MNRTGRLLVVCTIVMSSATYPAASQTSSPPQAVTSIDGGVGSCSMEITVQLPDLKPAAAASVKVHIAYGFGGFHKLDLEAGANSDGNVKFTGLPSRVRRQTLEFRATKGDLAGTTTVDPGAECHAVRTIKLAKPEAPAQPNP